MAATIATVDATAVAIESATVIPTAASSFAAGAGASTAVLSSAFAVLVLRSSSSLRSSCPRNVVLSFHALSFHDWAAPAAARRGQAGTHRARAGRGAGHAPMHGRYGV